MARYIDADELLRKSFRIEGHFDLPHGKAQNFSAINDTEILNFPTADVRSERHGHWIEEENGVIVCSECGEEHEWQDYRSTYCEDCGAKMDGDKNE